MKNQILTLLMSLTFISITNAQDDCCTALPLIGPFLGNGVIPWGVGTQPPDPIPDVWPCDCIQGEGGGSRWWKFSCTSAGTFELSIKPLTIGGSDFNFALYSDCACESDLALACNTETSFETGIADNPFASFGIMPQTGFAPTVTLGVGTNYYLFVDNVTGNGDIPTFEFGGTAVLAPPIADAGPPVTGPTTICPGATTTMNAPFLHDSEWNEWTSFPLIPSMSTQTISTEDLTIEWPEEAGTYQICVRALRLCGNSDTTCLTVNVVDIPVEEVEGYICFGEGYTDGNGTSYYTAGTYTVTYESFYGCDSIEILDLEVAPSEFIVLPEFNCEGDCVEFDGQTICESGTYQKVLTNQFGCDSTVVLNFVSVPIESIIEGEGSISCENTSVMLDGSTSLGGDLLTYQWVLNGVTVGTDPIFWATEGGEYTLITKSLVDGDTCIGEETIEILEDTTLPENVMASGGALDCNESSVILMASSSTFGVEYEWAGPNNSQFYTQNPAVTQPGEYTLTVTGLNGCTATATVEVIGDTVEPEAYGTGGTITCTNPAVTLMGNTNITSANYQWEYQFGGIFYEQNPEVSAVGNYTLTVTGSNGCTSTTTVTVGEDTNYPTANAGQAGTLNCFANEIMLNGVGSSVGGGIEYQWSTTSGNIVSGGNSLNPTINQAGTYSILVTNTNNGCTSTAEVEISESPPIEFEVTNFSNVNCFGAATGTANVMASGGDGTYSYAWSNGGTTASVASLVAGDYSATVTDGEGCTGTVSVTIEQAPLLVLAVDVTSQTAVAVNDGTASATPMGGTPGFSYQWSSGQSTSSISGLAPGAYTVTVTDMNGCMVEQTVTVSEYDCLAEAEITNENVSCNGLTNGSATVELENAVDPYDYIWSNDETTPTITDLAAGTYTVTVTDSKGCVVISSITIIEPALLSANATSTDESEAGANDGTATAAPAGGNSPYSYEWSTGEMTPSISDLAPGEYTVTVTDDLGCESEQMVTVFAFGCQVFATIVFEDVSCDDFEDGTATVSLTGGVAPFEYLWSNDETTATISNVPAGEYTVTILDDTGCEVITGVTIGSPPAINVEVVQQTPAGCDSDNGTATVMAEGGTGTLSYIWSSGGDMPMEEGLASGEYEVSVSDENDCVNVLAVTIASEDVEPPMALAQNITVILDADGNAMISVADIDDGSSDDCGIEDIVLDETSFNCSDVGDNTVTMTVTDINGNVSQTTAVVTVVDDTPPEIETTTVTLGLNTDGVAVLPPGILILSSSDNCLPVTLSAFPTEFDCDDLGENEVTLTATDASGNETVVDVIVDIVEDVNPSLNCPDGVTLPYCDATFEYEIAYGDNCPITNGPVLTEGLPSGSVFPEGQTNVAYELTDDNGNVTVCEFIVTVPTAIEFILEGIVNEVGTQMNGSIDVTIDGGSPSYQYEWTDEDGNVVGTTEDIDGLSAGEYTLEVTDGGDCVSSMTYIVETSTSADENVLRHFIKIFPNPTSGLVFLEISGLPSANVEVTIFDLIGHELETINVTGNGKHPFDISDQPEGVYLMKIVLDDVVILKRFVLSDN